VKLSGTLGPVNTKGCEDKSLHGGNKHFDRDRTAYSTRILRLSDFLDYVVTRTPYDGRLNLLREAE
jgi:hypothetical protein